MGLLEPITHKNEIEELISEGESTFEHAKKELETKKATAIKSLQKLGKVKIDAWSNTMDAFVSDFNCFNDIEFHKSIDTNMSFSGYNYTPKEVLLHIKNAAVTANEIGKIGVSAGSGALLGLASYAGVMKFGKASTGTAITELSGIAKKNATLAWFGGGSLTSGGLGKLGGKFVIAGIVAAPIIATISMIVNDKFNKELEKAKQYNRRAKNAAEQINNISAEIQKIIDTANLFTSFTKRFNIKFKSIAEQVHNIKILHQDNQSEKISMDKLDDIEIGTLNLALRMAQIYHCVLSTSILTEEGCVSESSKLVISEAKTNYKAIQKETFKMTGQNTKIADLIWKKPADLILYVNIAFIILSVVVGCFLIQYSVISGIINIIFCLCACPVCFKAKNIPQSKLFVWRIVRLALTIIILIFLHVLVSLLI